MIKTLYRILVQIFSKIIKTDNIADKFPVSVKAIIIDQNRVLCLRNERSEWDLPGGKINFNESVEDCLIREVKEETNLSVTNLSLVRVANTFFNGVPLILIFYSAKIQCESPINISFEHSNYDFFDKSKLNQIKINEEFREIINKLL